MGRGRGCSFVLALVLEGLVCSLRLGVVAQSVGFSGLSTSNEN